MMKKKENTAYAKLALEFNLLVDEPMKGYTSFKIGGPADLLALPENIQELKNLLKSAKNLDIPIRLFGGGTNLLVADKGIRGLVILTRRLKSDIHVIDTRFQTKTIYAAAGERLSKVCQFAVNHSLSGLEFAAGIPGTIGGAVMMNAGIRSKNMSGCLRSIDVLNPETLEVEKIAGKDLCFSYRHLALTGIIVAADLSVKQELLAKIEEKFQLNLNKKNATQPVSFASAGCFFKNPGDGESAGELIEKSGLKGARINDAMVSEKHANFIVNLNNASCEDILLLKNKIQATVYQKYHIKLKTEVRIEGE